MPHRQGTLRRLSRALFFSLSFRPEQSAFSGARPPRAGCGAEGPWLSLNTFTGRSVALLLMFLALLLATSSFSVTSKQLVIDDFHAEVTVMPDSSVDVTETIHPHFYGTGWHGLYRTIPVEYQTPQGFNYSLFLTIESITDGDGNKLKYESSRERHYRKFKIYIPDPDNSVKTVQIRYTVSDALRFFEDHDEFYWNVTGDEWTVPIQNATAHIVLPEG